MDEIVIYIVMGVIYTIYSIFKNKGNKDNTAPPPPIFTEDTRPTPTKTSARKLNQPKPATSTKTASKQPQSIEEFLEGYLKEAAKNQQGEMDNEDTRQRETENAKKLEQKRSQDRSKTLRREKENRERKQQEAYQRKIDADRKKQAELIAQKSKQSQSKAQSLEVLDAEKYHQMRADKMHEDYIKNSEISDTSNNDFLDDFDFDVREAVIYDVLFRRKYN